MKKLAIDVNTIIGIGSGISAKEIMEMYRDTGTLLYDSTKGEPPLIIEGEVGLVDWNTEEGKAFIEKHKK